MTPVHPTENDVVNAVRRHLVAAGWTEISHALSHQLGEDIVVGKGRVRLRVEAKGAGSMKPGTKRYGSLFSSGQVLDHVSKAVYRALIARSDGDEAGVALPDNAHHHKRVEEVESALLAAHVRVYFVTADGQVSEPFEAQAHSWNG